MTTAREQARQAVRLTYRNNIAWQPLADAASDVWEPIVQALVKGIEGQLGSKSSKVLAVNLKVA